MRTVLTAFAFAAFVLSTSCSANYEIVKQASESPIPHGSAVVIREPFAAELTVDGQPERAATAHLSPEEQNRWVSLLNIARKGILEGLAEYRGNLKLRTSGNGPSAQMELTSVDLAKQDPRGTPKTKVGATLFVRSPSGEVKDEIHFSTVVEAEVVSEEQLGATRERRFRRAGVDLGRQAAEYLRARAGVE